MCSVPLLNYDDRNYGDSALIYNFFYSTSHIRVAFEYF
jgi:hypothetical protein